MKRIIYILTGIVLLSLSSCSDFLEPKSQSEYVPKDANALQEMLIGSAYPKQDKSNFLLPFLSFLDDDIQFHKTDYEFSINSLKNIEAKQAVYTWQPDMFFIMERNGYPLQNIWEGYYNYILGANAALDYIGDVMVRRLKKLCNSPIPRIKSFLLFYVSQSFWSTIQL